MRTTLEPPNGPVRTIANALIIAIIITVALGILGGLGQLFGRVVDQGVLGYVGVFVGSIGELIEILLIPLGGVIGAFTLSSVGGALTRDALKPISVPMSNMLGGILGAASGAIVLGAIAAVGTVAAWLGLLAPVVAAGLAAPLLPLFYRRFAKQTAEVGRGTRAIESALGRIGGIIGFVVTFSALNVGRALIEGTLPPQDAAFSLLDLTITHFVARAMLIGAVLGGVGGLLAGTKANFPIGNVLYTVTRTILNALRSIEPLIMGIVFVIWVGIGPFAGVLALALHSIASLGKLYSEQIESIDSGPIEALQSTGANRLQTIMYAVVPQVIPPFIAFTLYRWDINVRMSTIIGFVGGGGIGFLLQQQINLLRYREAGVAVLAIAIVVSILDYASAAIREHYT
jgi:phosphonate ABC transporter permease subunit PhnE